MSYSTIIVPLSQCSTSPSCTTMRTSLYSPTGRVRSSTGGVQCVARAGTRFRSPAVRVAGIVEHLHLDAGEVGHRVTRYLAHAKEYAAVAARGDLPFELEFEVFVLFFGYQVAAGRARGRFVDVELDRAVLDDPRRPWIRFAVRSPAIQGLAVEQLNPLRSLRRRLGGAASRQEQAGPGRQHFACIHVNCRWSARSWRSRSLRSGFLRPYTCRRHRTPPPSRRCPSCVPSAWAEQRHFALPECRRRRRD